MKASIFIFLFALSIFSIAQAQTEVTFNVNMKPMLEDSSFVPGQDVLRITGSEYPLGPGRSVQMYDNAPIDSIYTVKIRFSNLRADEVLEYNFQILKPENQIKSEVMKRRLQLRSNQIELPAIFFNAFER